MSDGKSKQGEESSPKGRRRSSLPSSLDKKGGGRGKDQRKKGKKDVVTSASVFSMGPADRPMEGRTGMMSIQLPRLSVTEPTLGVISKSQRLVSIQPAVV